MLAYINHILPITQIIRARTLPTDGNVLVQAGQSIEPTDTLAEAYQKRRHIIIDIAREFNLSSRRAASLIQVKKGQKIKRGDVLAASAGLFGREIKSKFDGRVATLGGAKIVIQTAGSLLQLKAAMSGEVIEIIPGRGALLRLSGSLLQGVWGNDLIDTGVMMSTLDHPDDIFQAEKLDISMRNAVILGGYVNNPQVFQAAEELALRGLILSSMSSSLLPLAQKAPYPVLLLEGFGRRAINPAAYKLLSSSTRRVITINAARLNRQAGTTPELYIPLPVSQEAARPNEISAIGPGQGVRILSICHANRLGTVLQINPSLTTLPNGIKARTAEIQLESGEKLSAPLNNLVLLD